MALTETYNIERPGARNQGAVINALHVEQVQSGIEGTIDRKSILKPLITMRPVRGTSILTKATLPFMRAVAIARLS